MFKTRISKITAAALFIFVFGSNFYAVAAKEQRSESFKIGEQINLPIVGRSKSENFEQILFQKPMINSESQSRSFIIKHGASPRIAFSPRSQNWRWYDDEDKRTPVRPLAPESVAPGDLENDNIIKLRITLKETAGIAGKDIKFKLQFSTDSSFSGEVYDLSEISDCAIDSIWCYADGAGGDNEVIDKKLLSDSDQCKKGAGKGCGTHNESGLSLSAFKHKKDAAVEYEFTIKSSGAEDNRIYFFRAYDVKNDIPVPHALGSRFPSIATTGTKLVFKIQGVAALTATEGVVTDASTTPTGVDFGFIPFNREMESAQRLMVTTNARHGYKIYLYERQGLVNETISITPVAGTNEEPLPWYLSGDATSAYGYHTGDDTLSGGSIRFAPNNTYARFESIPKEIAYHSFPVHRDIVDVIFKIESAPEQVAGDYESSIVYVAVPSF